jgi:hypothetical protein
MVLANPNDFLSSTDVNFSPTVFWAVEVHPIPQTIGLICIRDFSLRRRLGREKTPPVRGLERGKNIFSGGFRGCHRAVCRATSWRG